MNKVRHGYLVDDEGIGDVGPIACLIRVSKEKKTAAAAVEDAAKIDEAVKTAEIVRQLPYIYEAMCREIETANRQLSEGGIPYRFQLSKWETDPEDFLALYLLSLGAWRGYVFVHKDGTIGLQDGNGRSLQRFSVTGFMPMAFQVRLAEILKNTRYLDQYL